MFESNLITFMIETRYNSLHHFFIYYYGWINEALILIFLIKNFIFDKKK